MGSGRERYGESNGMLGLELAHILGEINGWSRDSKVGEIGIAQKTVKMNPIESGKEWRRCKKVRPIEWYPWHECSSSIGRDNGVVLRLGSGRANEKVVRSGRGGCQKMRAIKEG